MQLSGVRQELPQPCPFKPGVCTKEGGVCSIRLYQRQPNGEVSVVPGYDGMLRATCPFRFHEGGLLVSWIGERLLSHPSPRVVKEVGFLKPLPTIGRRPVSTQRGSQQEREIGRIDMILVHPEFRMQLQWCGVEMQAVYFSGYAMSNEFRAIALHQNETIPFPAANHRPDYRSSGPKRLLPQLQIKVRDISRWGKRMAVVVDRGFFDALARMRFEGDISNADIAWFVVRFQEDESTTARLTLDEVYYTRLEDAVQGLTGGKALTQAEFEARIREKLGLDPGAV